MKTTCADCGKTWGGTRASHCTAEGLSCFALWPATPLANFDAPTDEETPHGGGACTEDASDSLGAVTDAVETFGFVPIDSNELRLGHGPTPMLGMMSSVFLGGQNAEVARIVVGAVSIDVVDVLAAFRASDETVLVHLDVLIGEVPPESVVTLGAGIARRRERRWFFAVTEDPRRFRVGAQAFLPAGIAPPALAGSSGDDGLTIDASNVHALIIQWSCHESFSSEGSGDKHRRGEYPSKRYCSTEGLVHDDKRDVWKMPGTWVPASA